MTFQPVNCLSKSKFPNCNEQRRQFNAAQRKLWLRQKCTLLGHRAPLPTRSKATSSIVDWKLYRSCSYFYLSCVCVWMDLCFFFIPVMTTTLYQTTRGSLIFILSSHMLHGSVLINLPKWTECCPLRSLSHELETSSSSAWKSRRKLTGMLNLLSVQTHTWCLPVVEYGIEEPPWNKLSSLIHGCSWFGLVGLGPTLKMVPFNSSHYTPQHNHYITIKTNYFESILWFG